MKIRRVQRWDQYCQTREIDRIKKSEKSSVWGRVGEIPNFKPSFDSYRYLYKRPIHFQSVSTARATLDAAHQHLYPDLARLAVEYLEKNLNATTVLEIYQGLGLYANDLIVDANRTTVPSAPPSSEDVAGEIGKLKHSFQVHYE